MLKLIIIALIQSATLASAQVLLKLGMERVGTFEWTAAFWGKLIANWSLSWPFAACGIGYAIATLLWLYMLKVYDFSLVYPMTSLNYIFGMFLAGLVLQETIPVTRWIGVICIVIGLFFVVKH